jgi:predicted Zn-dependent protease
MLEKKLLDKGMAYFYQKNYAAAADNLGQAADLNRNNVWARFYYVYSIAMLGRKKEASKWLPNLSSISKTTQYKQLISILDSDNTKKENKTQITEKKSKKTEKKSKKSKITEEKSKNTEEKSKITEVKSKNTEKKSKITEEKSKITEKKSKFTEEKSKITEEKSKITEEKKETRVTLKKKKSDVLDEAEYYIDSGDNEKALPIIRDYMKNNPARDRAYKLLAMIDFNQKDYQSSADKFEKAFQEGIKDFDSYFLAAQSNLNIQNYDTALVYYEKASQINSKDLFVKISLADLYCDRSNYDNSARLYQEILKEDPNYLDAKIGLAKIEFKKGYIEESIKLITDIIDENPDNAKAHHLKSQILLENKDYDNALIEAETASSFNPTSIEFKVFCSIVKIRNFKINEAVDDLQKILEIFPDNTYALTALGEAQLTEGKMDEGKATLLKSESIKKMPETSLLLALIECNNKNYEKADLLYKEYCSLAGNSPEALLEYANFTELKDNKEECLNSYYAVLEKFPGTPFAEKAEKRANEIRLSNSRQSK